MSSSTNSRQKFLIALDFDHTVIEENCDIFIQKLAPGGKMPPEIQVLYKSNGWILYMSEVFRYLHSLGVTPEKLLGCLKQIKLSPGMKELFTSLPPDVVDFILISDTNSVFINYILDINDLAGIIKEVFTNPATFDASGRLCISHYHQQDWCKLSTKNMCKGQILCDYVCLQSDSGNNYSRIAYVGDGFNDLCPSLCLNTTDAVFPRKGYSLIEYINKMEDTSDMKAEVVPWSCATEILSHVELWCNGEPVNGYQKLKSPRNMHL